MGVDTIPTKTDGTATGEIGRALIDRPRPLDADPRYEVVAAKHERLKDAVIANAAAIGTTVAPAPGSLEARIAAIEAAPAAPNVQLGALLWEWNETDVSQFEGTALSHGRDIATAPAGGDADTALTLTAHVYGQPFTRPGNATGIVLRITAAGLDGGGVFEVLASELTLPERYVVVTRYAHHSTGSLRGTFFLWIDGAGDKTTFEGYCAERYLGSSSHRGRVVKLGVVEGSQDSYTSPGAYDQDAIDTGGMEAIYTVHQRPAGDTPGYARISVEVRCGSGGTGGSVEYSQKVPSALIDADWDGDDMARFGIGCWAPNANQAGTVDFSRIRIYAHPDT